jgi:hypothetical protein
VAVRSFDRLLHECSCAATELRLHLFQDCMSLVGRPFGGGLRSPPLMKPLVPSFQGQIQAPLELVTHHFLGVHADDPRLMIS